MKYFVVLILALGFIGCSKKENVVHLESGIQYLDDSLGTGNAVKFGDLIKFHFRAWVIKDSTNLFEDWSKDTTRMMTVIGNSVDMGHPLTIKLGTTPFIKGSDSVIAGMKAGGVRTILIPASQAYGEAGYGPIPPNSSLKLVVYLLEVKEITPAKQWEIDSSKIVTTKSGLQYVILQPGDKAKPDSSDIVTVHYSGFLTDGKVFDSSVERDEPFQFRLKVQPLIQGWVEGVQLVGKGGKVKLIVPPALGYGEMPMGNIPPHSTLIFDIEVLDVQKITAAHK